MRLRFGLRTLLVLMMCVGAIGGYYGNRIHRLASERAGLDELSQSWSGVSVRHYLDQPKKPEQSTSNIWQSWIDWPLGFFIKIKPTENRIHAYRPRQYVESISLFAGETKPRLLKGIEKLPQLQNLRFQYSPGVGSRVIISGSEFRRIGELKNLRNLSLSHCYTDNDALDVLASLNLTTLTCGDASWSEKELGHVSKVVSLEELTVWTTITRMEPLTALNNLKKLSLRVDCLSELQPLTQMQSLNHLVLTGQVCMKHLDVLQRMPNLKLLELHWVSDWIPAMTDTLLGFPSLSEVAFNTNALTKKGFEKLVAAGIEVDHRGLSDFKPTENYLRYEVMNLELDLNQSEIVGEIQIGMPTVDWRICAQTTRRFCPTNSPPPSFNSKPFSHAGDWRSLVGVKSASTKLCKQANLVLSGEEHETYDNYLEIFSRDGNCFQLRCGFTPSFEEGYGVINAGLCLRRVVIKSARPIARGKAAEELLKHFKAQDFDLSENSHAPSMVHEFRLTNSE